jgi:hypothetical protein
MQLLTAGGIQNAGLVQAKLTGASAENFNPVAPSAVHQNANAVIGMVWDP